MIVRDWSTKCLDWEQRIVSRSSLIPDNIRAALFDDEAERALRIFKKLRCPDIEGFPTYGEICDEWVLDLVRVIFGSYDPVIKRRMIREFFLLIPKKNGKALALHTEIATPTGFTTMGELREGDLVIGDDGRPTKVLWKGPVYTDHDCYEVEFSTGEKVIADAGHLWVTDAHRDRDNQGGAARRQPRPTVKTTEEIARTLTVQSGGLTINNHRTALAAPLDLPDVDLRIDPYVLGAWLGDGTAASARITSGHQDAEEMLGAITACGQAAYAIPKSTGVTISLTDPATRNKRLEYRFWNEAKNLGILGNKQIPQIYLRGSIKQRLALLQGLMDTDGTISKAGQASFTTTSPALRDGMRELVNSLGLKATVSERRATLYGRDCGPKWDIQFWPFDDLPVFRLQRKLGRQRASGATNSARSKTRQIVACRKVDPVPVQCIAVDNASKQFLITRSLIPTHNSSIAAAIMVTAALMNRRPSAECLLIAPTKKIADIAFTQAQGIIRLSAALSKLFLAQPHQRTITHRKTLAVILIKAADKDVITGSKATFILVDETHVFAAMSRAEAVFVEVRGSLAARPDGFMLQITTQSKDTPTGVFKSELNTARNVRDGKIELPLLAILYELPAKMVAKGGWKDPKTWDLVNPNLGKSVDPIFLGDELRKAEQNGAAALALLASQHFNVEIDLAMSAGRWVGADHWIGRTDKSLTFRQLLKLSDCIVAGVDGGGLDDLFGLALLGRHKETRDWLLWSHAWCHKGVLKLRQQIAPRLEEAQRKRELTIVDDDLQDISKIVRVIKLVHDLGLLGGVAVDPAGLGEFVDELAGIEITQENKLLIGVPQGFAMMNAIKTCERKLAAGTLKHSGSELMNWCIGNLKIEPTATAIRATKQSAGDAKIDPAMAMFDAAVWMQTNPEAKGGRALEKAILSRGGFA